MAIYHCSVKTIGRSGGSSIVNSAAYRSGEKLYDVQCDKTFFYSGKILDVMHKEVMAPNNAPEWVKSREKLWNEVEKAEKRKDSQLAREVEVSLPREFTNDQNIALVREYVEREFVDKGMVADVCLHYGKRGDNYNPHAHILLTMRNITEDGFGKKNVSWNSRELLSQWRESWAGVTNKHLSLNGFEITVDHRSLEAQGIDLRPQNVELPNDAKGRLTDQRERQLEIMRENGERLKEKPEIALDAITRSKSTFTNKDIARYLHSRTIDGEQFQEIFGKIRSHESLVKLAEREGKDIYTTKEMLDIERTMFRDVSQKSESGKFRINDFSIGQDLSLEQQTAVEYLCKNKDFRAVVGYAGTGKTHMLSEAREIWEKNGYKVKGAALSGMAAQGLMRGSGIESRTVARRLIDWENGRDNLGKKDILVIDEAGMLGTRDVARVMREAQISGAKVAMLGDPQQLQAIEAGAAFRGIVEREGCLEMSDIRRQSVDWQREATRDFAMGEVDRALDLYKNNDKAHECEHKSLAVEKMVEAWSRDRNDEENSIMLAYRRADVKKLNEKARLELREKDEIGRGIEFEVENGRREFAEKDQIYFLRNDNDLEVKNGTLAKIVSINKEGDIGVSIKEPSGERELLFNVKDYNHLDHGYAATVHKSQGVTVDKSYVLASKGFNQHIAYVAMSRHVKDTSIFWGKDDFEKFSDLKSQLSLEAKKDNALDYLESAKDFADTRGIWGTYKDICVRGNQIFAQIKDVVQSFTSRIKGELAIERLEERNQVNKGIESLSNKYGREIDRDIQIGEQLQYFGNEKIADKDYALMVGDEINKLKLIPLDKCQDLHIGNEGEVHRLKDNDYVVSPSEKELWSREVNDIKQEFGKSVTIDIERGDVGIYRGEIKFRDREYALMEGYDKVALVERDICYRGMKDGDYMKIEKSDQSLGKEELKAVHDIKTQKQMERERTKELERDRGIELSI
jgi:Ti-type conjugative transfer relaxase TraA